MRGLLDTHILLWISIFPERLPAKLRQLVQDSDNDFSFSTASIWEIAIKQSLGRDDFDVDPAVLRRQLLDDGYIELPVLGSHAAAVSALPLIHRDPFDRMLIAQALVDGVELLTADARIARYQAPIRVF